MRVAILSHNARMQDAVGNQIAEKVRFFLERGAEVRVFVEDDQRLHPDLDEVAVVAESPSLEGPTWAYLRESDLVFAVYGQDHRLLEYLPCLEGEGPRVVFDYQGVTPAGLVHESMRDVQRRSERQRGFVWCADHALTASQFATRELADATRFPGPRTTALPLPIDASRFRAAPSDRFLQRKLGIDGRIVLFVGRLAPNKRVPLLIEAIAKLDRSVHAVLVGDINDVYAVEAAHCLTLARELGVADRVHFVGQLADADLPRAYRSAEVLVVPSRHEAFCVPVLEAMAAGVPVIASRRSALPETVGDAGLTFVPDDADDLARVLRCVLHDRVAPPFGPGPRRVAIVSFRIGPDIVGGAETSLRSMAESMHAAGHHVEVFSTCTRSESRWSNELPAGTMMQGEIPVHRYPIDPHDADAHGETFRAILEANGDVAAEVEERYLRHSIHSTLLVEELVRRQDDFDAIVTGPYLFGLTADLLATFPGKVLLAPCFHDEPLARLSVWPHLASEAGGILYHSVEEKRFAQNVLGVNYPNSHEVGACLELAASSAPPATPGRPFVVYCGRYSEQKNVPLLLDWAQRYQAERPGRFDFVFMGQGNLALPREPWLRDLGWVDEAMKRNVLAGARVLIQLSTHESLSLVALEAWREGTPVIAHQECAVLKGQIDRCDGGATVDCFEAFSRALDELHADSAVWHDRGQRGKAYVYDRYASATSYVDTIVRAIERMHQPLREQMCQRGLERAQEFGRPRWQQRFAEFVDRVLTQPARRRATEIRLESMRSMCHVAVGARTVLLPVRLTNVADGAAVSTGPGRMTIGYEVNGEPSVESLRLPGLLIPGESQVAALPIAISGEAGRFSVRLRAQACRDATHFNESIEVEFIVNETPTSAPDSCASAFLETIQQTLPRTHQLQQLPSDYVDVSEGALAPVKRLVKRKLLHNFKHAYVDVLSRQQSEVNGQVVVMIQQLAECCAMLDHAVQGLHRRLDAMEARLDGMTEPVPAADCAV